MPNVSRPRRGTNRTLPGPSRRGGLTSAAALLPLAIGLGAMVTIPKPGTEAVEPSAAAKSVTGPAKAVAAICGEVEDSNDCHSRFPAGCSKTGKYDAVLAFLKDKTDFPAHPKGTLDLAGFLDKESALPSNLGKNNHKDAVPALAALGEGKVFATVGFLYAIKKEGKESSNCELETDDAVDYHMFIGYDANRAATFNPKHHAPLADKGESVIVEMTPQYREKFHPEWDFDKLNALVGKQVKVTGQLLADNEHFVNGQDCALRKDSTCFRATIWELHPVTGFEICADAGCSSTTPVE